MKNETINTTPFPARRIVLIGLCTAITCILAPFSIPIPVSPVPITMTTLVVMVEVYLLGARDATISYVIYLLLGLVGLPVFSGFSGGLGKLAGPTGGYLIGMIFLAVFSGLAVERFPDRRLFHLAGMVLGMAVTYIFGTFWLAGQMGISFFAGLAIGCLPYLIGDTIKVILALLLGPILKSRILRLPT